MKFSIFLTQHKRLYTSVVAVLVLLFGGFYSNSLNAQGIAVYDNTNFISLAKQLAEAGKQTSNMMQMVSFLNEQKQNFEKVNAIIKQLRAVQEITSNNRYLVNLINQDLRNILKSPYIRPNEIKHINDSFQLIIDHSLETIGFINQVLSSYNLKMRDAERVRILQEKQEETREMVSLIKANTKHYEEIIAFRALQKQINNRYTTY